MLDPQRKSFTLKAPYPLTKKQLRGFLRMTGFCWIWIPGYGKVARPSLYEKLRGKEDKPLDWDETCKVAFNALKGYHYSLSFKPPGPGKAFQAVCLWKGRNCSWDIRANNGACITTCSLLLETTKWGSQRMTHLPRGSSGHRSYG